jgi:hypothetical protein
MRSWRELALLALLVTGCATDGGYPAGDDQPPPPDPDTCETSYLRYDNFGEPFVLNWCRGCHSSSVPAGMRQKAPLAVNFDTVDDVRAWKDKIMVRAAQGETMPPAGGPTADERALLTEWLGCGAH